MPAFAFSASAFRALLALRPPQFSWSSVVPLSFPSHKRTGADWRHALAMAAIGSGIAAVMFYGEGYPTEDLVDGESMSAAEHVRALNDLGDSVPRALRHEVLRTSACNLQFTSLRRSPQEDSFDVDLLTLDAASSNDRATGLTTVAIGSPDGPDAQPREVYQTARWHEAIAYRSHLRQLVRLCAESQARAAAPG